MSVSLLIKVGESYGNEFILSIKDGIRDVIENGSKILTVNYHLTDDLKKLGFERNKKGLLENKSFSKTELRTIYKSLRASITIKPIPRADLPPGKNDTTDENEARTNKKVNLVAPENSIDDIDAIHNETLILFKDFYNACKHKLHEIHTPDDFAKIKHQIKENHHLSIKWLKEAHEELKRKTDQENKNIKLIWDVFEEFREIYREDNELSKLAVLEKDMDTFKTLTLSRWKIMKLAKDYQTENPDSISFFNYVLMENFKRVDILLTKIFHNFYNVDVPDHERTTNTDTEISKCCAEITYTEIKNMIDGHLKEKRTDGKKTVGDIINDILVNDIPKIITILEQTFESEGDYYSIIVNGVLKEFSRMGIIKGQNYSWWKTFLMTILELIDKEDIDHAKFEKKFSGFGVGVEEILKQGKKFFDGRNWKPVIKFFWRMLYFIIMVVIILQVVNKATDYTNKYVNSFTDVQKNSANIHYMNTEASRHNLAGFDLVQKPVESMKQLFTVVEKERLTKLKSITGSNAPVFRELLDTISSQVSITKMSVTSATEIHLKLRVLLKKLKENGIDLSENEITSLLSDELGITQEEILRDYLNDGNARKTEIWSTLSYELLLNRTSSFEENESGIVEIAGPTDIYEKANTNFYKNLVPLLLSPAFEAGTLSPNSIVRDAALNIEMDGIMSDRDVEFLVNKNLWIYRYGLEVLNRLKDNKEFKELSTERFQEVSDYAYEIASKLNSDASLIKGQIISIRDILAKTESLNEIFYDSLSKELLNYIIVQHFNQVNVNSVTEQLREQMDDKKLNIIYAGNRTLEDGGDLDSAINVIRMLSRLNGLDPESMENYFYRFFGYDYNDNNAFIDWLSFFTGLTGLDSFVRTGRHAMISITETFNWANITNWYNSIGKGTDPLKKLGDVFSYFFYSWFADISAYMSLYNVMNLSNGIKKLAVFANRSHKRKLSEKLNRIENAIQEQYANITRESSRTIDTTNPYSGASLQMLNLYKYGNIAKDRGMDISSWISKINYMNSFIFLPIASAAFQVNTTVAFINLNSTLFSIATGFALPNMASYLDFGSGWFMTFSAVSAMAIGYVGQRVIGFKFNYFAEAVRMACGTFKNTLGWLNSWFLKHETKRKRSKRYIDEEIREKIIGIFSLDFISYLFSFLTKMGFISQEKLNLQQKLIEILKSGDNVRNFRMNKDTQFNKDLRVELDKMPECKPFYDHLELLIGLGTSDELRTVIKRVSDPESKERLDFYDITRLLAESVKNVSQADQQIVLSDSNGNYSKEENQRKKEHEDIKYEITKNVIMTLMFTTTPLWNSPFNQILGGSKDTFLGKYSAYLYNDLITFLGAEAKGDALSYYEIQKRFIKYFLVTKEYKATCTVVQNLQRQNIVGAQFDIPLTWDMNLILNKIRIFFTSLQGGIDVKVFAAKAFELLKYYERLRK
jgi:hypothetical protein